MASNQDTKWMKKALKLAQKAASQDEVPIGAILVSDKGKLIATAYNKKQQLHSAIAHAEISVIHRAGKSLQNWRLENCTLYVTVEPCTMCMSAILQSRIGRVVYGCIEPKMGAISTNSFQQLMTANFHKLQVEGNVLEKECSQLMTIFFESKREASQQVVKDREVTAVFVFHKNKLLGFTGIDPTSHKSHFFLPGGKIENKESAIETGIRETLEETGYKIKIFEDSYFFREYLYPWDGQMYRRKTHFYVAELNEVWHEPELQNDADYNKGPRWISFDEIPENLNYHAAISMAASKALKYWKRKNKF